jgi:hypothetical protein
MALMKDSQKRPLIGLLVLLAGLFILSEFLPGNVPESGEKGVPSTTVPLAVNAPADDQAAAEASAPPPPPGPPVAQAPESGPLRAVDASAPPLAAPAKPARPAVPAQPAPAPPALAYQAPPTPVSSMPQMSAQDTDENRPAPPPKPAAPKPAAKPVEAKPAEARPKEAKPKEAPKAETRPAAPQAPALKLAQSLPPPSKAPAPPPPPPARPTPPPAPPVPKLATSVQAPPAPVAAGQSRLWYVQIGSFADQGNAQTTLNLLQNIGLRGESSKVSGNGSALYRVRLGPFPSEAVAQQAYNKVSHQGYPQARVFSEASSAR